MNEKIFVRPFETKLFMFIVVRDYDKQFLSGLFQDGLSHILTTSFRR